MSSKPRILLYDIETFSHSGRVWGKYEQNVIKFDKYGSVASIAYRWHDKDKIHVISRRQFKDKTEASLLKAFHAIMADADFTVAHNGDSFDKKMLNAHYVKNDLPPPKPTNDIDTKKLAKKYFRFPGNSLNDLADFLGIGRKLQHNGYDMWEGCENGDAKSWNVMEKYNKQDVNLLAKVYERLRPWVFGQNKISLAEEKNNCDACGGDHMTKRGFSVKLGKRTQRLQCQICGAWKTEK